MAEYCRSLALDRCLQAPRRSRFGAPTLSGALPAKPLAQGDSAVTNSSRKSSGAYFTPEWVASCLTRWAVRSDADRLLDPSCGDGRFIACHRNSVGIEQHRDSAARAMERAPWALVHEGEFFDWAANTRERFECAAGNPPFIRYQSFRGDVRHRALSRCAALGARFSGLTSSWAPFLVATASLLNLSGRMAFVVPAEIGHASYAAPLLEYLAGHFDAVQVIAIRKKLFPELSEDCWLLYAAGFGGKTRELRFTVLDQLQHSAQPPQRWIQVPVAEWRDSWNRRLRPFLLSGRMRSLYRAIARDTDTRRLGDLATTRLGYVTGANDFFHLRPSTADNWRIPEEFLCPTVRNGRALRDSELTSRAVNQWVRSDEPMMLLRIPKAADVPSPVRGYLDTAAGLHARTAYKCRTREPWYSVPDVRFPDLFLTYMAGLKPNLVLNSAGATCTNAVHSVVMREKSDIAVVRRAWDSPFVTLSCEIEGHALGGGMLKLELREAGRILVPTQQMLDTLEGQEIQDAIATMRSWRHCAAPS